MLDLSVAQGAMAELECPQGRLQGLVLARLARVVLLSQDALAGRDTGREVTATLATIDVVLSDEGLAAGLGALELLLLLVGRWMPAEELEGKVLVLFSLLRCERLKSLKLDKGLRAVLPASVEHASDDHDAVDLPGRELLLILDESHGGLHSCRVLLLVKLSLA